MKKLLFLSLILMAGVSRAAYIEQYQFGQTSFTQTNESTARISSFTLKGGIFLGVVIGSPSAGGSVTFADAYVSTGAGAVTYATFSVLSLSGSGNAPVGGPYYIPFNVRLSSGLAYTTTGNAGGITIIYKSFGPVH